MDAADTTERSNLGEWLALGAIVLGLLLIGIGVWVVCWGPGSTRSADAHVASVGTVARQTFTPQPSPTGTNAPQQDDGAGPERPGAGATAATIASEPTSTTVADRPVVVLTSTRDATPGRAFHLTILHTNDTWGYTLPCG